MCNQDVTEDLDKVKCSWIKIIGPKEGKGNLYEKQNFLIYKSLYS